VTAFDAFDQHGYGVRLEWGPAGVAALVRVCSVLVVVDVLSFTTAVDVAVSRGATVLPLRWGQEPPPGAVVAGRRGSPGAWSLSPPSLLDLPAGIHLALPSPNGATLSVAAASSGIPVLAGCLRNASAVAAAASVIAGPGGVIGVAPSGERWPDDRLRVSIEDLMGAGAIITALAAHSLMSPEALVAVDAFATARMRGLSGVLADCSSGRELAAIGFAGDVAMAAEYDVSRAAPLLRDGAYIDYAG